MDNVDELRRVIRGYRQRPPRKAPAGLLDDLTKLEQEVGPARSNGLSPAPIGLESELRAVAQKLIAEGGVSNVAGTLLHGILGQLETPGRPAASAVIDAQPNHAGQIPEPAGTGSFPS